MRISDWSSDVCSSDLSNRHPSKLSQKRAPAGRAKAWCQVLHERFRSRAAESWTVPADQPKSVQLVLLSCLVRMRAKRLRSEEHTSELQSLMRISYAVFCLKTKNKIPIPTYIKQQYKY